MCNNSNNLVDHSTELWWRRDGGIWRRKVLFTLLWGPPPHMEVMPLTTCTHTTYTQWRTYIIHSTRYNAEVKELALTLFTGSWHSLNGVFFSSTLICCCRQKGTLVSWKLPNHLWWWISASSGISFFCLLARRGHARDFPFGWWDITGCEISGWALLPFSLHFVHIQVFLLGQSLKCYNHNWILFNIYTQTDRQTDRQIGRQIYTHLI